MPSIAKVCLTLVIAAMGGALMWRCQMPLAWLLGAMAATGVASVAGLPLTMPAAARIPMLAVVGAMLGSTITVDVLAQAGNWAVPLLGLFGYIFAAGSVCYVYFRRIAGFDPPTAFFAGMPGGVVEMVELGAERGGDARMIALTHAARIFLVVLCLPFLIEFLLGVDLVQNAPAYVPLSALDPTGAAWFLAATVFGVLIGKVLRLPAYFLLGPMLLSAAMHASGHINFTLPTIPLSIAQVVLGATVGSRFAGVAAWLVAKVLTISIGATAILLSLTFGFSVLLAGLTGGDMEAFLLAYAPGGLAEMSLVALSFDLEVAFVVCLHIARVFIAIASATAAYRWFERRGKA